ncbi:metallophosphoesterase [Rhodococcus sp. H29-C3]|uniref:metallophosphoesterase family protein n=1 Tax=Rhodococcus sp. H29-C3 TaxID=3046307 RepID=UPI0024B8C05C|nr:metallophosphoesterase [Rhodococcus sp. H29-C3]MDJ0361732.1 metallophosphoesterase [Rhodococcus sp. H29-C3]
MKLLLLADTHVPTRARMLPGQVWTAIDDADVVIHAGDWVDVTMFGEISARSKRPISCWGNNDGDDLRARMPECARVTLDGVRIAVVHETGSSAGREQRMAAKYPSIDVLVFGHSHIPWDTVTDTGVRLLNPGSPTDRRRQPFCTYMTAEINDGILHDVELHRLEPRLRSRAR